MKEANLAKVASQYAEEAAAQMRASADKDMKTIEQILSTAQKQSATAKQLLSAAGIEEHTKTDNKTPKAEKNTQQSQAQENLTKITQTVQSEINQAILQAWQKRIDINKDGYDKELDQIELNLAKEAQAIADYKAKQLQMYQDQEKTAYVAKNGSDKGFESSVTSFSQLPTELQDYVVAWEKAAIDAQNTGQQQLFDTLLNDYSNYANTYINKAKEFDENIKNLESTGASTSTIESVKAMQAEMLAALDEQMQMKDATFVEFMDSIVDIGLEELLSALDAAKTALEAAQMDGDNDQGTTVLKSKIKALQAQITVLTQENKVGAKSDPAKKWRNTLSVMNDVKSITQDVIGNFEGLDDTTKIVLDSAMNIATGVINMIIGITTLTTGSAAAMTTTSVVATEAIKGVEKASVILAIIGAALQIAQAIGNAISGIFSNDKKKEKEIKKLQEQVDALKESYDLLSEAIKKTYTTDAKKLIEQEEQNLKKQKALIQKQIKLEEDKKKTDKDKVQEYKDAIKEIDKALGEIEDRAIEAIIGKDVKSAIEEFSDALTDAMRDDGDKQKAIKDTVKKLVQSAVSELIKSRLSPEVTAFMEFLAGAMEDGILSQSEEYILDELEKKIYDKANSLDSNFDKYFKSDVENEDSLAGQIRGTIATEQSVSELGGIFRGMWDTLKLIEKELNSDVINSLRAMIIHLKNIEDNTKRSADNSDRIVDELKDANDKLDTINNNTKPDTGSYGS